VSEEVKSEQATIRIRIEGVEYSLDPESLSWGEIETIETYFGKAFEDVDLASARGAMLIAYLAKKRTDATFTLDDIRRLPMNAVEVIEEPVPTVEDGDAESGVPSSPSLESGLGKLGS